MISIGTINYQQEEIEYSNNEVKLRINNSELEGGELIITKSEIAWKRADSQGFSIPIDKIVVQAISPEHQRSIYFMIDCSWDENQHPSNGSANNGINHQGSDEAVNDNGEEEEDDSEEYIDCDDEESNITEFWMVPDNRDEVDVIYYTMFRCQQNENMEGSDEDDEDNFLDGEDIDQMNINDNDERFADD